MPHRYLFRLIVFGLIACLPAPLRAQQRAAPVRWLAATAPARLLATSPLAGRLTAYRATTADRATLAAALATAPLEGTSAAPLELLLPLPDGGTARFQVVESSVMEPGLAAQFPDIKTYVGIGLDDPTATLRADLTPQGFHAQVLSRQPGQTFYLDPVSPAQPTTCLSYWRRDLRPPNGGVPACLGIAPAGPGAPAPSPAPTGGSAARPTIALGTSLRTYRLAVAATGEYTQFHGGTVAAGQAAIVTTVNRVTGVYEKELAVRMILVANNSSLIYTNAATDPYANTSGDLAANQTNITTIIGSANYDIGHLVGTGGGGVAGLGVVCNSTQKARGLTGSPAPIGDAFDIDYVAHEMGHQFSGNHTFNGSTGSCAGGNRNASTAWEPGSGATIQAYAGICSPQDLQPNSDAYFHGGSVAEMGAFIAGTSCPTTLATGNTLPTVAVPANKSIPVSTPFQLTATGSDANGDPLTYCWEEMDLGAAGAPINSGTTQTASATPPLFRSFLPVASPTRYFPRLSNLRNNTFAVGEYWPTVARTLTFRCTIRDVHSVAAAGNLLVGGVNQSSNVVLTAVSTAGPFVVSAPNTAVTWVGGSTQTVTWSVANTNVAPVSCSLVNVLLSTDGGLTFPTTIVSGVPNNGSASIVVPNSSTTQARIMVAAADNYFFDISNTNFTITLSGGPIISSFSPGSGAAGTAVTITGSNFTGSTAVRFNGTNASSFTVNSSTQITATVASGTTTGPITVTNGTGTGTSSTDFVVPQVPIVTSFSPTSGPVGTSVTVTGTGFTGVTGVSVNGTAATTYTVNSATQITLTVPTGATTGAISVTNNLGTGNSSSSFTVTTPPANDQCTTVANLPLLTCGTPLTGTTTLSTSTGDPTVTCNTIVVDAASGGVFYRFVGTGNSVTISTCGGTTNYDTKLFVYTGACGTYSCVTANDDNTTVCGAGALTSAVTFTSTSGTTYVIFVSGYQGLKGNFTLTATCAAAPAPTITSFTPTSGPVGTVVSITGTNLTGLTGVSFNGTAATTFSASSATAATATVPTGATTGTITVSTASGSGTSGSSFTVTTPPANDLCTATNLPVLTCGGSVTGTTTFSTSTGDPTATCSTITIDPASGGVFYRFAGTGASVTVSTCGAATNYDTKLFVYSGTCGSLTCVGGNDDLRCGSGPTRQNNVSAVTFTSVAGTDYLIFVSGFNGATGNFVLSATCANAPPSALALSPASVSENTPINTTVGTFSTTDPNPGNTFTYTLVTGTGSADNASFNITGATLRTSVVFDFETRASYSIRVRTTDQGGLSFERSLTVSILDVAEPPVLSAVGPAADLPGAPVTLTGTGFTGTTSVLFNGVAASFTVVSSTQISAVVPANATSGPVVVSNLDGPSGGIAFTVYTVYNALTNQCVSATSITSTGTGNWRYLLAGGQVVAAINDQGQALGTLTADLIVTTGAPRADAAGNDVLNRNWRLTAANTFTGQSVGVRFYALNSEYAAYQAANDGDASDVNALVNLKVRQYGGPNEDCLLINNVPAPAADLRLLAPTITEPDGATYFRAEVVVDDHFSEFYLQGENADVLPVSLTTLRATRTITGGVAVTWATASESRNQGWIVERATATEARSFAAVSPLVAGAGSSAMGRTYAWTDASAPAGALNYRLRQLDTDGRVTRSDVVTVKAVTLSAATPKLALVPNPAHGAVRISGLPVGAPLVVIDAVGRVVRALPASTTGAADVDLQRLVPGVYTVRAGTATARLVVE